MEDNNNSGAGLSCLVIIGSAIVLAVTYGWLVPWLTVQAFSIWGIYLDQSQVFRTWLIIYLIWGAIGGVRIKINA